MSLRNLLGNVTKELSVTIEDNTEKFFIKPISLNGISTLLECSPGTINSLLVGEMQVDEILSHAPEFAIKFLKLGLVEELTEKEIDTLPMGVQLVILESIWDVSKLDVDYMGKLLNRFVKGMKGANESAQITPKNLQKKN